MGVLERRLRMGGAIRAALGFAEHRELIIRSSGRVYYLPLPRTMQLGLLLLLIGVGGWSAYTSALYFRHYELISGKEAQLAAIEEHNEALLSRMSDMHDRFSDVTGTLEHNHRNLVGLVNRNTALQRELQELRSELRHSEAKRAEQTKRQVTLNRQLMALEAQVDKTERKNQELAGKLDEAQSTLSAAQTDRSVVVSTRDWLKLRVKGLEDRLASLGDSQRETLVRISRRTATEADRLERLIASTGLKLADLIKKRGGEDTGSGGPFVSLVAATEKGFGEAGLELIDRQMARWEELQELVRSLPLVAPMQHYRLTSTFGGRKDPINGKMARHDGIDLSGPMRSPIYATAGGKVVFSGWKGGLGRAIVIDHGNGIRTRYGHLRSILVKRGQKVAFGQKIGQLGSSGRSTGPHVHYEILVHGKPVDPEKFLKAGRNAFKG